jgi:hypothetical protein
LGLSEGSSEKEAPLFSTCPEYTKEAAVISKGNILPQRDVTTAAGPGASRNASTQRLGLPRGGRFLR